MLVVDASILAPVVADAGPDGHRLRNRLRGEVVAGPDLLRIEAVSVLRRHAQTGRLTEEQAATAVEDVLEFPLRVFPTAPLLTRVWDLCANLSAYDACYVAIAEVLGVPLLTADQRLARAPGIGCTVEVL